MWLTGDTPIFDYGDGGVVQDEHDAGEGAWVNAVVDAEAWFGAFGELFWGVDDFYGIF